jgi:hypothetical protein
MVFKDFNSYSIIHSDGRNEQLNAESMEQALQNMEVPESESPVARCLLVQEGIRTLVSEIELPTEIVFTAVVDNNSVQGGSIATPASGHIHIGDEIQLRAVPARNYRFVSWSRNGQFIGNTEILNYVMTPLVDGEDSAIFTAAFELAPVSWTTEIEPPQATGTGCIAFPTTGTTPANAPTEFLAVASEQYAFSHWERHGEELSTNKLFQLDEVKPLADDEFSAVYKAVFTRVTP